MENKNSEKVWTEEERSELAAKLDTELDDYINQLEKKTYTEGWSEDRWQEEMEKHPFFMKKAPKPGEELSPLMEGLQQLKFGEDYNTPEELANNYKEDGNFNYKHKKYRMAIISYTEGIKTKCKNQKLIAELYNNRAASHYMLQNYRSSLNDSKLALKSKPDYAKCLERAATCCFHIKDYDQCIEFCKLMLILSPNDKIASDLLRQAMTSKKKLKRDKRKEEKAEKNVFMIRQKILSAVKSRGINLVSYSLKEVSNWEDMEFPTLELRMRHPSRVYLGEDDRLVWPVLFGYPEFESSDHIIKFHEDTIMLDMMLTVFNEPSEWDTEHRYTVNNVELYFEGRNPRKLYRIDVTQSLGNILSDKRFIVCCGLPVFWVFTKHARPKAFLCPLFFIDFNHGELIEFDSDG